MVHRKPYDFGPELLITSAVVRVSRQSGAVEAVENYTSLPSTSAAVTAVEGVSVKDTTVSLPNTDEIAINDTPWSDAEVEMKQTPAASRPDVVDPIGQPGSDGEAEEINRSGSKNQWFKIWTRRFIFCLLIFMC